MLRASRGPRRSCRGWMTWCVPRLTGGFGKQAQPGGKGCMDATSWIAAGAPVRAHCRTRWTVRDGKQSFPLLETSHLPRPRALQHRYMLLHIYLFVTTWRGLPQGNQGLMHPGTRIAKLPLQQTRRAGSRPRPHSSSLERDAPRQRSALRYDGVGAGPASHCTAHASPAAEPGSDERVSTWARADAAGRRYPSRRLFAVLVWPPCFASLSLPSLPAFFHLGSNPPSSLRRGGAVRIWCAASSKSLAGCLALFIIMNYCA